MIDQKMHGVLDTLGTNLGADIIEPANHHRMKEAQDMSHQISYSLDTKISQTTLQNGTMMEK